jgi:hypothetical protein
MVNEDSGGKKWKVRRRKMRTAWERLLNKVDEDSGEETVGEKMDNRTAGEERIDEKMDYKESGSKNEM